ncbi:DUF58 domain-containing protein [Nocardia thailandica]
MVVTGRFALLATAAAVLVMLVLPSWAGVAAVCAVLLVVALADVVLAATPADLACTRVPLTVVRLGQHADVELAVTNTGRGTVRGRLWDTWPGSSRAEHGEHRLALAPSTRVRVRTTVTPSFRGDRTAGPVVLRLLGPLGMAGRQYRIEVPTRVRALPAFRSERLLRSKIKRLHHLEGRTVANTRGQGTEFDSFREYVAGDDVRAIDWRATARANDVLVRTWRPERNRHMLMVLDTGRSAAGRVGEGTRLDASIEAALLLGGLAAAAGDTVDLLAYDNRLRTEVSGAGGRQLQVKLLHALAGVTPRLVDTDVTGLVRTVVARSRRRALIVWFTALDAAAVTEHLLPALPVLLHRHRVLIVSVTDPDIAAAARDRSTTDAVFAAAAAESVLAERALVGEQLRRRGVAVVSAAPDRLAEALADEYLELKQSGSL